MNKDMYTTLIEDQIKRSEKMLLIKGKEYATEDMLHTFRKAANLQNISLIQAIGSMMAKHTISIYDMIASPAEKAGSIDVSVWDEKITDHINYLLILSAAVREKNIAYNER